MIAIATPQNGTTAQVKALDPAKTVVLACTGAEYPTWSDESGAAPLEIRLPAALVPGAEAPLASALESLVLEGVTDVIVAGHLGCPTLSDVLAERTAAPAAMERALDLVAKHYSPADEAARRELVAQETVLVQLERLRALPLLRRRQAQGLLKLHGWLYEPGQGMWSYDFDKEQFEPIR